MTKSVIKFAQSPKRQLLFGCRGQQHHHQVANTKVSILEVFALWVGWVRNFVMEEWLAS